MQERRAAWFGVPRRVRAAIRRLHAMINHGAKAVTVQISTGARVDPEIIQGVKHFKCDMCAEISKPGGNLEGPGGERIHVQPRGARRHLLHPRHAWMCSASRRCFCGGSARVVCML